MRHLARMLGPLRPVAGAMAGSLLARTVYLGLDIGLVGVAAWLVVGAAVGTTALLWPWVGALAVGGCLKAVARYLEQYLGHQVAFGLLASMRVDFFRALWPLVPAGVADLTSGDLVDRATGDVDRVEVFYAHTLAPAVTGYLVPAVAAAAVAALSPQLGGWLALGLVAAGGLVPLASARLRGVRAPAAARAGGELAAFVADGIRGLGDVVRYGAGRSRLELAAGRADEVTRVEVGVARRAGIADGAFGLVQGLTLVALAGRGIGLVEAGAIDQAGLAAALAVGLVAFVPLRELQQVGPAVGRALAAAGRVFAVFDRVPSTGHSPESSRPAGPGHLVFEEVGFGYPGRRTLLDGVSLEVVPGRRLAVVGPSGAGKSTLSRLAVRFWEAHTGRVRLDGEDVRHLAPGWLRRQISLVTSRPHLFSGTIADNIALGNPTAGREEIEAAARLAAAHDFIEALPAGYDTLIGAAGAGLSGGQRQRVALARALLVGAPVLILDEATADLDVDSERQLLAGLAGIAAETAILIIAHRLATVVEADEIVVLDRGRVVERGTHVQLVGAGGLYARLWAHQLDTLP